MTAEYSGLWRQDSLSGLDLDLAPLDFIHEDGLGHSVSQLNGVKV